MNLEKITLRLVVLFGVFFICGFGNTYAAFDVSKIVTGKQEVIDTYRIWDKKFNVYSIPKWKYDIMKDMGLNAMQIIHYHSINSIECGRELGDCVNEYDIGPFQINKSNHEESYNYSKFLIDQGSFDKLYRFQLEWTYKRLERYKKTICKDRPEDKQLSRDKWTEVTFGCMLKVHNGNDREWKDGSDFKVMNVFKIKGLTNRAILMRLSRN